MRSCGATVAAGGCTGCVVLSRRFTPPGVTACAVATCRSDDLGAVCVEDNEAVADVWPDAERGRQVYEDFRLRAAGYSLVVGELPPWPELPLETQRAWATTADVLERRGRRRVQ